MFFSFYDWYLAITFVILLLQANFDGVDIPLPFNMDILKWANKTREVLRKAKVPPKVKFYNIYGTDLDTPHSVW